MWRTVSFPEIRVRVLEIRVSGTRATFESPRASFSSVALRDLTDMLAVWARTTKQVSTRAVKVDAHTHCVYARHLWCLITLDELPSFDARDFWSIPPPNARMHTRSEIISTIIVAGVVLFTQQISMNSHRALTQQTRPQLLQPPAIRCLVSLLRAASPVSG